MESLLAFAALAGLLTVTPGADMALATSSALRGGVRAAVATAVGVTLGVMAWAAASAAGLAALFAASAAAYGVLKLAGAAYLVVLGATILWRTRQAAPKSSLPAPGETVSGGGASAGAFLGRGLATNLLNPKIALFYSTLLPQFLSPGDPVLATSLLLAAVHAGMGLVWLSACGWAVVRAGCALRGDRVRRTLERLTGAVLVGLGLGLALERR